MCYLFLCGALFNFYGCSPPPKKRDSEILLSTRECFAHFRVGTRFALNRVDITKHFYSFLCIFSVFRWKWKHIIVLLCLLFLYTKSTDPSLPLSSSSQFSSQHKQIIRYSSSKFSPYFEQFPLKFFKQEWIGSAPAQNNRVKSKLHIEVALFEQSCSRSSFTYQLKRANQSSA